MNLDGNQPGDERDDETEVAGFITDLCFQAESPSEEVVTCFPTTGGCASTNAARSTRGFWRRSPTSASDRSSRRAPTDASGSRLTYRSPSSTPSIKE
jgi:hypothetical protein